MRKRWGWLAPAAGRWLAAIAVAQPAIESNIADASRSPPRKFRDERGNPPAATLQPTQTLLERKLRDPIERNTIQLLLTHQQLAAAKRAAAAVRTMCGPPSVDVPQ